MLPAVQPQPEITTLEQYENFPENRRLEVFEGVVYDMASPSQEHQTILTELLVSLRNYIRDKGGNCFVFPAPFDVKLNDNPLTIVQPDLMIICDKDKLDGKRCNGAPDWVIEVVSPASRRIDYTTKLFKYRAAGVREYWIVDADKSRVMVYNFYQDDMNEYSFIEDIPAGIYTDLSVRMSNLEL